VFASIFDCGSEELAVGLDVVFWSAADSPRSTSNMQWLHTDQNHRSGLTHLCAQGVLYVWPSEGEDCSTTAVWPGSHLQFYERLMQDGLAEEKGRKTLGSQSVRINHLHDPIARDELAAQAIAGTRRVPCPAGSLLLWDSRTIHQGWAGGPRLAQPVCWEPRCRRDGEALLRKLYMCAAGVPSSHSSSEGRVHGMARPGVPKTKNASHDRPALRAGITPYCVAEGCEEAWRSLQDELWVGKADPTKNCNHFTTAQGQAVQACLRRDVLAAL